MTIEPKVEIKTSSDHSYRLIATYDTDANSQIEIYCYCCGYEKWHQRIGRMASSDDVGRYWEMRPCAKVGKKVYYRDHPGIVSMYYPEQNAVMISPAPGTAFPADAQTWEDYLDGGLVWPDGYYRTVKIHVSSSGIYWDRKRLFGNEVENDE